MKWLEELEHKVFGMPKPDIIFYLHVPVEVSQQLLQEKAAQSQKDYQKDKIDLVETDLDYQRHSRESALKLIQESNNWVRIDCVRDNTLLDIQAINNLIFSKI